MFCCRPASGLHVRVFGHASGSTPRRELSLMYHAVGPEWFTVWWVYPNVGMSRYALHSSEITVVPGRMYCWMLESTVCLLLSGTTVIKALGVPLSIPPNTLCPSTERPRLYLRFPNFDSSISTTFPGPPIVIGCARKYSAQTSLKKLNQSMATLLDIFTSGSTYKSL